ncbi:MAG: hypothetical protein JWP04_1506, partial [Belnapia sp.]|nr:hypothetical protein [Belnapia sp.]
MEAMLILLVLGFFLGWGLGIAGYVRAGGLQRRVVALEAALRAGGVPLAEAAPAPPSPWARPEEPAPDRPEAMPPEPEPV